MLLLALRLRRSHIGGQQTARHVFAFSILYLFLLFAMLLVDTH
jgi:heme O synthase-like polyprenyltransferase